MKRLKSLFSITSLFALVIVFGLISCKNKDVAPSEYVKGIKEVAAQLNKKCPEDQKNGTKLESVTFSGDTLTFRLSLSDQAIVTINLDNTRDSLIHNMSDKLRKYLVKGKCYLTYKYISPNDSSSITIVPNELGDVDSEEK